MYECVWGDQEINTCMCVGTKNLISVRVGTNKLISVCVGTKKLIHECVGSTKLIHACVWEGGGGDKRNWFMCVFGYVCVYQEINICLCGVQESNTCVCVCGGGGTKEIGSCVCLDMCVCVRTKKLIPCVRVCVGGQTDKEISTSVCGDQQINVCECMWRNQEISTCVCGKINIYVRLDQEINICVCGGTK